MVSSPLHLSLSDLRRIYGVSVTPVQSFCLSLYSVHSLCQLLANPSPNPVKERYAVSSYLG